jgi:hypothetical protein
VVQRGAGPESSQLSRLVMSETFMLWNQYSTRPVTGGRNQMTMSASSYFGAVGDGNGDGVGVGVGLGLTVFQAVLQGTPLVPGWRTSCPSERNSVQAGVRSLRTGKFGSRVMV